MFNYLDQSTPPSPISYLDDFLNPNFNLLEQLPYYCSSYNQLPSPLIYNEINNLGDFLSLPELSSIQQGGSEANTSCMIDDSSIFDSTNMAKESNKGTIDDTTMGTSEGSTSTRRSRLCKKGDRHSKIRTAHGLRDRRMRLSLKVARPFFMLQDMLGYDKASTTVEWLLMQAKRAIEEQLQSKNNNNNNNNNNNVVGTSSNNCDEEVLDQSVIIEETRARSFKGSKKSSSTTTSVTKDGAKEKKRKRGVATKESRKEARDRARKRTLERMQRTWGGFNVDVSISTFNYQQNNGDMPQNGESYSISMQQSNMGGIQ